MRVEITSNSWDNVRKVSALFGKVNTPQMCMTEELVYYGVYCTFQI